jgi:hypothetical protein
VLLQVFVEWLVVGGPRQLMLMEGQVQQHMLYRFKCN